MIILVAEKSCVFLIKIISSITCLNGGYLYKSGE